MIGFQLRRGRGKLDIRCSVWNESNLGPRQENEHVSHSEQIKPDNVIIRVLHIRINPLA